MDDTVTHKEAHKVNPLCCCIETAKQYIVTLAIQLQQLLSLVILRSVDDTALSVVHNRDWDVTATRKKHVHYSATLHTRLQPITTQESVWAWSTSCGVIVYCYFHVFQLNNKGNLLSAVVFLFNDVDFIRYGTRIRMKSTPGNKKKYDKIMTSQDD